MNQHEIRREMERLNGLLGTWHNQINAIATSEANRALAGMPTDQGLVALKDSLVLRSGQLIDVLQALHDQLVSKPK